MIKLLQTPERGNLGVWTYVPLSLPFHMPDLYPQGFTNPYYSLFMHNSNKVKLLYVVHFNYAPELGDLFINIILWLDPQKGFVWKQFHLHLKHLVDKWWVKTESITISINLKVNVQSMSRYYTLSMSLSHHRVLLHAWCSCLCTYYMWPWTWPAKAITWIVALTSLLLQIIFDKSMYMNLF